jgi:glycosyltransferase involved in cell wall biosynthesis
MRVCLSNVVGEAKLCNCIVVGSDVRGVRTVVGEHGFLVSNGDVGGTGETKKVTLKNYDLGGRLFIISNFFEEKRSWAVVNRYKD